MKKLFLILLFSNFLSVFAQDVEDKSYLEIQDELYQHLDKDNMSTGVFIIGYILGQTLLLSKRNRLLTIPLPSRHSMNYIYLLISKTV